jgi:hypothetical protein
VAPKQAAPVETVFDLYALVWPGGGLEKFRREPSWNCMSELVVLVQVEACTGLELGGLRETIAMALSHLDRKSNTPRLRSAQRILTLQPRMEN